MLEGDVELFEIDRHGVAAGAFLYALGDTGGGSEHLDGRAAILAGGLGPLKLTGRRHHYIAHV